MSAIDDITKLHQQAATGPWRRGAGGEILTDDPTESPPTTRNMYGGSVIAESCSNRNRDFIIAVHERWSEVVAERDELLNVVERALAGFRTIRSKLHSDQPTVALWSAKQHIAQIEAWLEECVTR